MQTGKIIASMKTLITYVLVRGNTAKQPIKMMVCFTINPLLSKSPQARCPQQSLKTLKCILPFPPFHDLHSFWQDWGFLANRGLHIAIHRTQKKQNPKAEPEATAWPHLLLPGLWWGNEAMNTTRAFQGGRQRGKSREIRNFSPILKNPKVW